MKKKVISLLLAVTLIMTVLSGCAGGQKNTETKDGEAAQDGTAGQTAALDTSKQVEIVMYYLGTEPAGQQVIWDKLNELLLEKLNCTLKVNYISFADYPNKYPLLFSSGEVFDIAYTASWLNYSSLAQKGAFMELDELWPAYAPDNYALASETAKKQAMFGGVTYCIPSLNKTYSAYGPVYRKDLVESLGFNKEIKNFQDMEEYMDLIKANYPEMQPIAVYSMGSEIDDSFMYLNKMYPLSGSQNSMFWMDPSQESPKVMTYYEYEKTPEFLETMSRWNEKGFYPKSVLSDTDSKKFENGLSAMVVHNSDNYKYQVTQKVTSNPEWKIGYTNFTEDISNLSFTQDAMVISNTSANPERAMALWNLLTTNEEAHTLFVYGIEGVSYQLNDKGEITMLDTDNYGETSMWAVRNSDFMKNAVGTPADITDMKAAWEASIDETKGAQKFRSFVMDVSAVETEFSACQNAHQQYWWPLELGYTDAVKGLLEYQKMMEAAGVEKVKAELQRQLDEYVKAE